MNDATYVYEKGIFKISDPGLGIEVTESYTFPEILLHKEEGREEILPSSFSGICEYVRHDQTLKSRSAYKNGLLHGPSYTYFTNRQIASERWYVKGLLHGRAIDKASSGKILSQKGFFSGRLHGPFTRWYPSGKLLSTGEYARGWSTGTFKVFDEEELLSRSTDFKDGRRHGIDEGWTDDGFFLFCERWENGKKKKSIVKDFLF